MYFEPDTYTYAPVTPFSDSSDGKVYIWAYTHGALTAKTPYLIYTNEYGNVTAALSDIAVYAYVAVPNDTFASGVLAKLQIGGYCEDVITPSITSVVGYALRIYDGAVALVSADFTGAAGQFAACTEVSTATTHDLMLCGHIIVTVT